MKRMSLFLLFLILLWTPMAEALETAYLEKKLEDLTRARVNSETTYLAYNLDERAVRHLVPIIEKVYGLKLKTRGEAHLTLLTPAELRRLRKKLPLGAIRELFEIRRSEITLSILCIGVGQAVLRGQREWTFYLVVQSPDLYLVRKELTGMAQARGLESSAFDPELYYPHITLGFTAEDLHLHQGVIKDPSSCSKEIALEKIGD